MDNRQLFPRNVATKRISHLKGALFKSSEFKPTFDMRIVCVVWLDETRTLHRSNSYLTLLERHNDHV